MLSPSHPSFCSVPSPSFLFLSDLPPLLRLSLSPSLQVDRFAFAISQCHFCGLQLVLWLQLHSHKNEHWQVWLAAAGGTVNLWLPPLSPLLTLLCCPDILCLCVWVIHLCAPTHPSLTNSPSFAANHFENGLKTTIATVMFYWSFSFLFSFMLFRKVNKCYRGRSCPIIVHCR